MILKRHFSINSTEVFQAELLRDNFQYLSGELEGAQMEPLFFQRKQDDQWSDLEYKNKSERNRLIEKFDSR